MPERQNKFPWTEVSFGVASLLMFGLSHHKGRRAKQLKEVQPVSSVSEALGLSELLPVLIAVRGTTGSVNPLHTDITASPAVMIEDTFDSGEDKRSASVDTLRKNEVFKRNRTESDWFITDDGISRLTVESCGNASHLENTLVTSKRFVHDSSTSETAQNRTGDHPPLGRWHTEKSLPVDKTVTVVGELANSPKEDGTMVIREPSDESGKAPFYITTQTFDELRRLSARSSGTFKWLGAGFGAVSLVLVGMNVWKRVRAGIRDREERKRIAEEEKKRIAEEEKKRIAEEEKKRNKQIESLLQLLSLMDQDKTNLGRCVVCWDNKVDAVFIPCGHLCACRTCCEKLEKCPVCRNESNVHKVYTA